jgi:hypothetical protein
MNLPAAPAPVVTFDADLRLAAFDRAGTGLAILDRGARHCPLDGCRTFHRCGFHPLRAEAIGTVATAAAATSPMEVSPTAPCLCGRGDGQATGQQE